MSLISHAVVVQRSYSGNDARIFIDVHVTLSAGRCLVSSPSPSLFHPRHLSPIHPFSALPETLDPASYAHLLPCCRPRPHHPVPPEGLSIQEGAREIQQQVGFKERRVPLPSAASSLFFYMEGGASGDERIRSFEREGVAGVRDTSDRAAFEEAAFAADKQEHRSELVAWFMGRVREMDSLGGQLRNALSLCELGVARVSIGVDKSDGRSASPILSEDRAVAMEVKRDGREREAGFIDGAEDSAAVVEDLVRLRTVLLQLTSLVS